ncbi:hypothetical protein LRS74_24440 [Streptomyces sp. LX-29]|uniref:hypothetical protein n=1 Tax=Streptomyces sp. LX-29 TaxID=2900152 RepID=UPI00240E58DB|nr:hypothetical protein [Streptomyces sp. LX-29]WFB09842.1 hypothetical protein LRS74_24440 [Streptomyces sp. LX-29]
MRSLPLTLGARLLPVAALTAAGLAMTATGPSDARPKPAAGSDPSPAPSASAPAPRHSAPPRDACATLPAATVKPLVPGANPAGSLLTSTDATRRTGCSWHALHGYDYRWLDVTYDITPTRRPPTPATETPGTPVPDLGDHATLTERVTTEDGQRTREAVVVLHQDNAMITVTYNGSDFASGEAADADTIRKGALTAARAALEALAEA